ncbi:MAG: cysteine synthase family protein [Bacillales bacterium]|nr:cysteine synthase family protein [Bacillales bacterium]
MDFMLYENVLGLIGNTPIVKLSNINFELNSKLYAKIEKNNLSGSIKDRACYQMIISLINEGKLKKGSTIIEPTSGNTGIGIACLCNYFSLNCIIVMPESMSLERRKLIKDFNGKLELVQGGMKECKERANELNKEIPDSIILGQFDNENNAKAHYLYTVREILNDLPDVDVIICGIGTGGTISGIGKYIKDNNLNIEVIGVEPKSSPLITLKRAGKHKIQGIGANFIPSILDQSVISKMVLVSDEEAIECSRELVKKEGLFVGISSGANYAAAKQLINDPIYKNKKILMIFPDSGERYSWN